VQFKCALCYFPQVDVHVIHRALVQRLVGYQATPCVQEQNAKLLRTLAGKFGMQVRYQTAPAIKHWHVGRLRPHQS
jgi:hypothetical protein